MGFLLGAFGKLQAGRRMRDLQARLMRVSTKMRRAQRSVDKITKSLDFQKKTEMNGLTMFQQMTKLGIQNNLATQYPGLAGITSDSQLTADQQKEWGQYQQQLSMANAQAEFMVSMMKQQLEEKYESMNDMLLEPLKMEEESLQTEKDTLESQLQIAQADYEACKKMEQADAKNLAPNYTGQG